MTPDEEAGDDLSTMTKAELEEAAAARGIDVNSSMTKAEMLEALGVRAKHFVTPQHTTTSVPGRAKLSDEDRERIVTQAGPTNEPADESSLGGSGGTPVDEGGAP